MTNRASLYADQLGMFMQMPTDRSQYKEPDEVSEAFMHALFDPNPLHRYMVVPNEREANITIRKIIMIDETVSYPSLLSPFQSFDRRAIADHEFDLGI